MHIKHEKQKDGSLLLPKMQMGNFTDKERAHKPKTSCKSAASIVGLHWEERNETPATNN